MNYDWHFESVWAYRAALLEGALISVQLTGLSIVVGTSLGVFLAFARGSRLRAVRWPTMVVIEILRALPILVLLVWLYYCLPILTGVRLSAFWTAVLGLSVNLAAFAAETFRAGIEAVPNGQLEVARSMGLTQWQIRTRIVLPQATRQMMPALVGLYVTILKLSSLASVIAVGELLHNANNIISVTYRPLEAYTAVALVYVAIALPVTMLSQRLETKALLSRPRGPA